MAWTEAARRAALMSRNTRVVNSGIKGMKKGVRKPKSKSKSPQTGGTTHERLSAIAKKHLFIDTLTPAGSDRMDFHDVHVSAVHHALHEAYAMGAASAGGAAGMKNFEENYRPNEWSATPKRSSRG